MARKTLSHVACFLVGACGILYITNGTAPAQPRVTVAQPRTATAAQVPEVGAQRPAGHAGMAAVAPGPADPRERATNAPAQLSTGPDVEKKATADDFWVPLARALAWPIVTFSMFVLLIVAIWKSKNIRDILIRSSSFLTKVSVGGVELVLNFDAIAKLQEQLDEGISKLIQKTNGQYNGMAAAAALEKRLAAAVREAVPVVLNRHNLDSDPKGLRATIHVPDTAFKDYLYQIVGYYPSAASGGPAGRRFSQRYGLIGRAWRLEKSLGQGMAISGPKAKEELITTWGLTDSEVSNRTISRPAVLCTVLRYPNDGSGLPVGLLFIDSEQQNAFGRNTRDTHSQIVDADTVATDLETEKPVKELSRAVGEAMTSLRSAAGPIDIQTVRWI